MLKKEFSTELSLWAFEDFGNQTRQSALPPVVEKRIQEIVAEWPLLQSPPEWSVEKRSSLPFKFESMLRDNLLFYWKLRHISSDHLSPSDSAAATEPLEDVPSEPLNRPTHRFRRFAAKNTLRLLVGGLGAVIGGGIGVFQERTPEVVVAFLQSEGLQSITNPDLSTVTRLKNVVLGMRESIDESYPSGVGVLFMRFVDMMEDCISQPECDYWAMVEAGRVIRPLEMLYILQNPEDIDFQSELLERIIAYNEVSNSVGVVLDNMNSRSLHEREPFRDISTSEIVEDEPYIYDADFLFSRLLSGREFSENDIAPVYSLFDMAPAELIARYNIDFLLPDPENPGKFLFSPNDLFLYLESHTVASENGGTQTIAHPFRTAILETDNLWKHVDPMPWPETVVERQSFIDTLFMFKGLVEREDNGSTLFSIPEDEIHNVVSMYVQYQLRESNNYNLYNFTLGNNLTRYFPGSSEESSGDLSSGSSPNILKFVFSSSNPEEQFWNFYNEIVSATESVYVVSSVGSSFFRSYRELNQEISFDAWIDQLADSFGLSRKEFIAKIVDIHTQEIEMTQNLYDYIYYGEDAFRLLQRWQTLTGEGGEEDQNSAESIPYALYYTLQIPDTHWRTVYNFLVDSGLSTPPLTSRNRESHDLFLQGEDKHLYLKRLLFQNFLQSRLRVDTEAMKDIDFSSVYLQISEEVDAISPDRIAFATGFFSAGRFDFGIAFELIESVFSQVDELSGRYEQVTVEQQLMLGEILALWDQWFAFYLRYEGSFNLDSKSFRELFVQGVLEWTARNEVDFRKIDTSEIIDFVLLEVKNVLNDPSIRLLETGVFEKLEGFPDLVWSRTRLSESEMVIVGNGAAPDPEGLMLPTYYSGINDGSLAYWYDSSGVLKEDGFYHGVVTPDILRQRHARMQYVVSWGDSRLSWLTSESIADQMEDQGYTTLRDWFIGNNIRMMYRANPHPRSNTGELVTNDTIEYGNTFGRFYTLLVRNESFDEGFSQDEPAELNDNLTRVFYLGPGVVLSQEMLEGMAQKLGVSKQQLIVVVADLDVVAHFKNLRLGGIFDHVGMAHDYEALMVFLTHP